MRRTSAILGIVVVIALALLLLYKVWVHHNEMELYEPDGSIVEAVRARGAESHFGAGKNYPASLLSLSTC